MKQQQHEEFMPGWVTLQSFSSQTIGSRVPFSLLLRAEQNKKFHF